MARDHSKTGIQDGGGGKFIKVIPKDAAFETPDGARSSSFNAYLDRVCMSFKDAMPEHDLPARWQIELQVSAKLPGDPDEGANYIIPISSHWDNPILSSVMNALRGAWETDAWTDPDNRFFRIYLQVKKKEGALRGYCTALVYESTAIPSNFLPNYYKWNEGGRFYEGVPTDMEKAATFWLGVAHTMVKLTGGTVNEGRNCTIPLPDPIGLTLEQTKPAASAAAADNQDAPPSIVDRAKTYFDNQLASGKKFADILEPAVAGMKKGGATPADLKVFSIWVTEKGLKSGAIPFGYISSDGTWTQPEAPKTTADDDLPF